MSKIESAEEGVSDATPELWLNEFNINSLDFKGKGGMAYNDLWRLKSTGETAM